jgi:hypothetical protein
VLAADRWAREMARDVILELQGASYP